MYDPTTNLLGVAAVLALPTCAALSTLVGRHDPRAGGLLTAATWLLYAWMLVPAGVSVLSSKDPTPAVFLLAGPTLLLVGGRRAGRTADRLRMASLVAATMALALVLHLGVAVPTLRATDSGQVHACRSNLRNLATALEMYATDASGRYPSQLAVLVPDYVVAIPTCPSRNADTYSPSFQAAGQGFTLSCRGSNHLGSGALPDHPRLRSQAGVLTRDSGQWRVWWRDGLPSREGWN